MIEAGAAGPQRAAGFQRGPILVVALSAAVLLGAGLVWREELRSVPPWYFGLAMLGLVALTGSFGRWRLRLPWRHVGQIMVAASAVAIAVLAWVYADLVRDLEGPATVVAFAVTMVGASTVILPAPTALTVIALASSLDNPVGVGVAAAAGQTVGEGVGYLLGRSGSALLPEFGWSRRLADRMRRNVLITDGVIVLFAAVPNPVFDVIGIIAGSLRHPVWRYATAAFLGNVFKYVIVWGGLGALLG